MSDTKAARPRSAYRARSWTDPRAEARPSPIHGNGLFARESIRAGEVVAIVGGDLMTDDEFQAFAWSHARYNAVQIGEDTHLVEPARVTAQEEGSLNHSCDANLWMADEVTLVARTDIAAGEELTVDYALFTTGPVSWIDGPCRCGSGRCRTVPSGDDWMLPQLQRRYQGHFSPFINERIAKHWV